ncbi:MAG: hypothetical protein KIT54_11520 [Phycisphaeraceae bacterium]|nr:hypothetical protein [Phycisphaeraceae bacterium]
MSRLPDTDQGLLNWASQRLAIWAGQGSPPNIGITSDQVAEALAKLSQAQAALTAAEAIRQESINQTAIKDQLVGDLRATVAGLVTQIEGFAKASGDPGVYTRANVPAPKAKTPRTEAPVPGNLKIESTTNGNLRLTYDANKGVGSVFVIQRRVKPIGQPAEEFQFKVTTAEKTWLDTGVPHGLEWVAYQVATKLTNGVLSDWCNAATFNFGTIASVMKPTKAQQATGDGPGESLTIDDAQALRDAQTAKGKGKAG